MADILPLSTNLPDQEEYQDVFIEFVPDLESETESLISINIIDSRPNIGITINGAIATGQYKDSFHISENAIKVRIRSTGETKGYDSWETLPPPQDADIFEWRAPSVLTTNYTYTVQLKYLYTPSSTGGVSPLPEERELTKTYTQIVFGNWDIWAKKLRNYVTDSGPFPSPIEE